MKETSGKKIGEFFAGHVVLIILVTTLAISLATINGVWATDHTTAFVEFDYAVWAYHSFVLGQAGNFQPGSVDVFIYHGNYFMANAPGAAFIALPFAILGFVLEGHFTVWGDVLLLTEIPAALANAVAAVMVFKLSSLYFKKHVSAFLALCYAFSTISWPFATYLYQSDFAAMFDLIAIYFAIKIARADSDSISQDVRIDTISLALFCGLAVTAGTLVDYVNEVLIPIIGVYIFFSVKGNSSILFNPERIKLVVFFLLESAGLFSVLFGIYNYASFGMIFVNSEQMYLNGASVFTSFTYPIYKGMLLNSVTPMRGLLFYDPVLILGVIGFWRMFKKKILRETLFLLAVFLGIFLPYSAWYSVTGGISFGPRFLVAAIPYLLIPAGYVISDLRWKNYSFVIAYILFAAGAIENGLDSTVGVLIPPSNNWFSSPFLTTVVPDFLAGKVDSWWIYYSKSDWISIAAFIIAIALVTPLFCTHFLGQEDQSSVLQSNIA
ncbi:MAG: hypothetical protein JRN20_00070 [Nitrososphaerota archaeon]|nr:hypothetical protein [Nitrososphaerota archaeon]MDG6921795.1 hypothetical protein [Nitrososphaerota archaeon]